jgi:transposase
MTRLYGRAKKSERVNDYTQDVRFERTSVISTMRLDGSQAPLMFKGTLDGNTFATYTEKVLAPTLKEGDIVILDNLTSHKVEGALKPIYEKGASVLFLPPYSPDYNPIELGWSKMKSVLRKLKAATFDELVKAMKSALDNVSASDISNWFKHCGYIVNT